MFSTLKKASMVGATLAFFAHSAVANSELETIMDKRGLSEQDMLAAAKTYTPSGMHDEYYVFSSGGQSGQVIVYGVPSMRILKYIGVFTPEPWQGYGFDEESKKILDQGKIRGQEMNWGDTHHPNLTQKEGSYTGDYLFINDKANPRIAVINLHDFETTQIVTNPVLKSTHGGSFVTPNTEYIIDAAQYAAPLHNDYVPIEAYEEEYRGGISLWKFDWDEGKIDEDRSFTLELPPYMQDLSQAGKGESMGWAFTNSFNSEMYTGGIEQGKPPFEAGTARNDADWLHVYNWQMLEEVAKDPENYDIINDHKVVSIEAAVDAGALFLIPAPKSPHGVDVSPSGRYIIIGGKLDTMSTIYDWRKIQKLIKNKEYEGKDQYGIPILDLEKSMHGQVELGLGPLHNAFDDEEGIVYTSLYVDSQVVKWNFKKKQVIDKIPIHYNIGHIETMEGNSVDPDGKYLIALNKLSIDRFLPVGPLHPQNHQLIDISGEKMQMLYDMPIGLGEPHDVTSIKADKVHPAKTYEMGTNTREGKPHEHATLGGQERIERDGNKVEVYMTAVRSHINPEHITVNKGDEVSIYVTNLERAIDETHGFTISGLDMHASIEPGKTTTIKFTADKEGVFPFYCTEFCSALHLEMMGYLYVKDPDKEYPDYKAAKLKNMDPEKLEKEYQKAVDRNKATDKVIQSVVKFLKENDYQKYPEVKRSAEEALGLYKKADKYQEKADKAYKVGNVNDAVLWLSQVWQQYVKAADVGLRAKSKLAKELATPMSDAALRGEKAYLRGGCTGCHVIGKVSSGPDLVGALNRHANGEEFLYNFIMNPEEYYDHPYMEAMINAFKLKMPNQGMTSEETKDIIEYLKWVDENAQLF